MSRTSWSYKDAAGTVLNFTGDIIASVITQIVKVGWGAEGELNEATYNTPLPTADVPATIVGKPAATTLADDTAVGLPDLPGDTAGVFAVIAVSDGTMLWSLTGTAPDDPVPAGSGILFASGAQLDSIHIAGPATIHPTYYRPGEFT